MALELARQATELREGLDKVRPPWEVAKQGAEEYLRNLTPQLENIRGAIRGEHEFKGLPNGGSPLAVIQQGIELLGYVAMLKERAKIRALETAIYRAEGLRPPATEIEIAKHNG